MLHVPRSSKEIPNYPNFQVSAGVSAFVAVDAGAVAGGVGIGDFLKHSAGLGATLCVRATVRVGIIASASTSHADEPRSISGLGAMASHCSLVILLHFPQCPCFSFVVFFQTLIFSFPIPHFFPTRLH